MWLRISPINGSFELDNERQAVIKYREFFD
jgi:hypothetical protein